MAAGSSRVSDKLLARGFAFLTTLALAATPLVAQPAHAASPKISPALLAQMTAHPLERVPVIVEMNAASLPFSSPVNTALAQQAVSILQMNGQAVGGLPIIQGAA